MPRMPIFFLLFSLLLTGCVQVVSMPSTSDTSALPDGLATQTPLVPTATALPTLQNSATPLPTETGTPFVSPTPGCVGELDFYAFAYISTGTMMSYNAPDAIPADTLQPNGSIDLGDNLVVMVNGEPIPDVQAALYDPDHPERLFLVSRSIRRGNVVTVKLRQGENWLCSREVEIPMPGASQPATASGGGSASSGGGCHPGDWAYVTYVSGPPYPGSKPGQVCTDSEIYDDCGTLVATSTRCVGGN